VVNRLFYMSTCLFELNIMEYYVFDVNDIPENILSNYS